MIKNALAVFDLAYNKLCIINDNSQYGTINISEEYRLNAVDKINFSIPIDSPKFQHVLNENLVEWRDEYYFIKTSRLKHQVNSKTASVECWHLSSGLEGIQNGEIELIGRNARDLMTYVLRGEFDIRTGLYNRETGWKVGSVDVPSTKYRSLIASEQSVFSNLVKIAELFEGRLMFNSKTMTVDLLTIPTNRNIQIRKGKNLQSVDIEYDTSEIVTRLFPFGGDDLETGQEVNIMSVNPTRKSYIDNYAYYLAQGYTLDYINKHPELFLRTMIWQSTDYINPQALYDDSVSKLQTLSKPKVRCTVQGLDLSAFPEHFIQSPQIGEIITIIDEDLKLVLQAEVIAIQRDSSNPLSLKITISNEIVYNSIIKQLVDTSKSVTKIVNSMNEIRGQYIKEATIDEAHIKNGSITDAKIQNATITNAKIADATIDNAKIKDGTIDNAKIKDATIDTVKIRDGSITNIKIDNLAVDTAKIKDGSITNAKIADATIDNGKIANATIDNAKIKDGTIENAKIKDGTITDAKIQNSTITNAKIADATIDNAKIKDSTITSAKIASATIDTANIKDSAITNAKIGNLEVDSTKIKDGAITNAKIDNLAVDFANIKDGAIINAKIGSLAVDTSKIANSAITNAKIADATIDNAKIIDGTIDNAKIKDATIDTAKIKDASITNAKIENLAVDTAKIKDGAITNLKVSDVDASKIKTGTLSADRIGANTITANKLASDVGKSLDISSNESVTIRATKEEVADSIDSIQIGGRNLLKNTSDEFTEYTVTESQYYKEFSSDVILEANQTYVFSWRFESISGKIPTISIGCGNKNSFNKDILRGSAMDSVSYIVFTPTVADLVTYKYFAYRFRTELTVSSYKVKCLKLEKGNKPTDYTVAPEDISNNIVSMINVSPESIKIQSNKIDILGETNIGDATIITAKIKDGNITNAKISDATITGAKIANATIDGANIKSASIDTANIKSGAITTALIGTGAVDTAQIKDGSITNAKVVSLSADKITSSTLDTSKVTIQGANGKLKLANNRLQVFDNQTTPVERVSMGDVNGDGSLYGLRVRGADGKTILLDENGIKPEGITDGSITNKKIANDIDGAKLLDNSVNGTKIVAESVTAKQIASATITANEIASKTITSANIATGTITAESGVIGSLDVSKVKAGTMSADYIQGGTLDVGGATNGNGVITVLDSTGKEISRLDNSGINMSKGAITGSKMQLDVTNGKLIVGTNDVNATTGYKLKYDGNNLIFGDGAITWANLDTTSQKNLGAVMVRINGGIRNFSFDVDGKNQTTATAYSISVTQNGSAVTPTAYSWSCGGVLSGTGTSSTFTPTVGMYSASDTWVQVIVTVNGTTFTERIPISLSKVGSTGATGSAGANAKSANITASSQVFKSTDGGITFSPDTITLTPVLQTVTFSKWQYSINGGTTWIDASGANGVTIASNILTLSKSSALFSNTVTSITFKLVTNDSNIYNTITVVRLYDVTDIQEQIDTTFINAKKYIDENTGNLVNNPVVSGTKDRWSGAGLTVVNQDFLGVSVPVLQSVHTTNVVNFSEYFYVDPSKAYEVSVWVKKSDVVGRVYVGLNTLDNLGTAIGIESVYNTGALSNSNNTNFYFWYCLDNASPTDWVKVVGYIMPSGTSNDAMKGLGIFPNGSVYANARMKPNTRRIGVRVLNYSNGGVEKTLWVANPKVVEVDPNAVIFGVTANNRADVLDGQITEANTKIGDTKAEVKSLTDNVATVKTITEDITTKVLNKDLANKETNTSIVKLDGVVDGVANVGIKGNTLQNLITNGDFSNGITGWVASSGAIMSVSNNALSITSSANAFTVYQDTNINCDVGKKIYFKLKTKRINNLDKLDIRLRGLTSGTANIVISSKTVTVLNDWVILSGIGTITSSITGNLRLVLYVTNSVTTTETVMIDGAYGVTAIDLTAMFGAGKEPTAEQVDSMINKYIDGIQSLCEDNANKIEVLSVGKNLFDGQLELGSLSNTSGGLATASDCLRSKNFTRVSPNTRYVLSNNKNYANYIYIYDNSYNFISYNTTGTVIIPSNGTYVKLRSISSKTENDLNVKYQLEEGTTATTLEPYKSDKLDITLIEPLRRLLNGVCDEVIGSRLIRRIGKLVLNGSEGWSIYTTNANTIQFNTTALDNRKSNGSLITDKFMTVTSGATEEGAYCGVSYFNIIISKSKLTTPDVTGFKAWLSANPTTVYYELATPIEENLPVSLELQTFENGSIMFNCGGIVPYSTVNYPTSIYGAMGSVAEKTKKDTKILSEKVSTAQTSIEQLSEDIQGQIEGITPHQIILSNENQSILTDSLGATKSSTTLSTSIDAFRGINKINATIGTLTLKDNNGQTLSTTGVTLSKVNPTSSTSGSVTVTINSGTNLSADSGYIDIPITIESKLYTKKFTWNKSKDGTNGNNGTNGKTYVLNVTGGVRTISYDASGGNPNPSTSTAFGVQLYEDGVLRTPSSYSWSVVGNLSGSATTATFTPTIKTAYATGSSYVSVTVTYGSVSIMQIAPVAVTKDASGVDWVNDWTSNATEIKGNKVVTPRLFVGTNKGTSASPNLTGVAMGQDIMNGSNAKGIALYKDNSVIFQVKDDGTFALGQAGKDQITLDSSGNAVLPNIKSEKIIVGSTGQNIHDYTTTLNKVKTIDGRTDTLFSFDENLCSTNGVNPSGSTVVTMRNNEGKFGGALAVEEGTTNLINEQNLTKWTKQNTNVSVDIIDSGYFKLYKNKTDTSNIGIYFDVSVVANSIYTISFNVRNVLEGAWFGIGGTAKGNVWNGYTNGYKEYIANQINTFTFTPISGETSVRIFFTNKANQTLGLAEIKDVQIEQKPFATSFIDDTRDKGFLSYPANIIDPNQGTISLWYNPQYEPYIVTTTANSPVLIQVGDYYKNGSFTIWNHANSFRIHVRGVVGSSWTASPNYAWGSEFSKNTWVHLSVAWSGVAWSMYINGVKVRTAISTEVLGAINGNTVYIGCNNDSNYGTKANGLLDEVFISKRYLSDAEIKAIYDLQQPLFDSNPRVNPPTPTNVAIELI